MKHIFIPILLLLSIGSRVQLSAQVSQAEQRRALAQIAQPGSTVGWLTLQPQTRFSTADFFSANRQALGLTPGDEMQLIRRFDDDLGMSHFRYRQVNRGLPVIGAEYILHVADGRVVSANGKIASGLSQTAPAGVSQSVALEAAMNQSPSRKFSWLDAGAEQALRAERNDPDASYYPEIREVWIRKDLEGSWNSDNLVAAWEVPVYTTDGQSATYYIDVESGAVRCSFPISIHCDPGSGVTTWNGTQALSTSQSGGNFILLDDCQSPNVHVFNDHDSTGTSFATEYTDADNNWTGQQSAYQTFYSLNRTWNYYLDRHGRNSFDGAGATVNAYNQAGFVNAAGNTYWSNACFDCIGNALNFGDNGTDGTATDDWNTVDIVGHEFTHGVTKFSAGLIYNKESGALNESFSDIFGEMVEEYTEGGPDWLVGAERGAIRSFSNPNAFGDPDTYKGVNWSPTNIACTATNDQCGVHTNSSVQNYWFYLLSVGGSGYNDNGDYYNVQGIGTTKANNIAYRSLTVYLGSSSGFSDAKDGAIHAARDLFGDCSNEVLQCARAWNAVGVNTSDNYGYDIAVDCGALSLAHALAIPVHDVAFNEIWSDCAITANSAPVDFEAGYAITLKDGFRSGDNFHAYITPCASPRPQQKPASRSDDQQLVQNNGQKPGKGNLEAFPNPFDSRSTIRFNLDQADKISLVLLNHLGQVVQEWYVNTPLEAGTYSVSLENAGLPGGVYMVSLRSGKRNETCKIIKTAN